VFENRVVRGIFRQQTKETGSQRLYSSTNIIMIKSRKEWTRAHNPQGGEEK
jgi:hypothetical protein